MLGWNFEQQNVQTYPSTPLRKLPFCCYIHDVNPSTPASKQANKEDFNQ